MPSFALSEITRLASIPLSFTENRCGGYGGYSCGGKMAAMALSIPCSAPAMRRYTFR